MALQNTKIKLCKGEKEQNISPNYLGVGDLEMFSKSPVNVSSYQRLKMQENMLFSSARQALKSMTCCTEIDVELRDWTDKRKADLETLKDTYLDIKHTINILRSNISTLEKIKKLDVARYRVSVVELEDRIVAFKRFLREELELLQEDEQSLVFEVDSIAKSISQYDINTAVKSFTCIIPSKVKTLLTKPSVSPEVQSFQEFVDRAGGHNGGWGYQEHSMFVKFRKKIDNMNKVSGSGETQESHNEYLNKLAEMLCARIPGLTLKDVAHHETWFLTYQKLKLSQQSAIDKWRALRELQKYEQEMDKVIKTDGGSLEEKKCLDIDRSDVGLQTTVVMVNKKSATSPDHDHQLTLDEIESRKEARRWELESKRLEHDIRELSLKERRSAEANRKLREYRVRDRHLIQNKKKLILLTQIKPPAAAPVKKSTPTQRLLEYKVYRQCDSIVPNMIPCDSKLHCKLQSHTRLDPKSQSETTMMKTKQSEENNKRENGISDLEKSQSDTTVMNNMESDFVNLSNSRCYRKFMRNCNFEVFSRSLSGDKFKMKKSDKIEIKKSISDTTLQYDIESGDYFRMNLNENQSDNIETKKSRSDTTLLQCCPDTTLLYKIFDSKYLDKNKSGITILNEVDSGKSQYDPIELAHKNSDAKVMYEISGFDSLLPNRGSEIINFQKLGHKKNKMVFKNDQSDANQSSDLSTCRFAAPTKEWSQRVNNRKKNKNTNDWSRHMTMENIPKLGQPKWRRPLSANQGI